MTNSIAYQPLRPWLCVLAVHVGFAAGWFLARRAPPAPPAAQVIHTVEERVIERPAVVLVRPDLPTPTAILAVEQDGPLHYRVHRAAFDCHERSCSDPFADARFVPAVSNGHPSGIRVYAVRPGSLIDRLGIRNGDRLVRVNGRSLATPDHCLEAYSRTRYADRAVVDVERRGAPIQLVYDIVD
jgi:hypothetical protein